MLCGKAIYLLYVYVQTSFFTFYWSSISKCVIYTINNAHHLSMYPAEREEENEVKAFPFKVANT